MALHGTMEPWNGTMEVSPSRRNTLWELYVQKENICWWFCLISSCICFFLALELNFEMKNSNKAPNKGKLIIKNKQPLKKVRMTFYFSFLKLRGRFFIVFRFKLLYFPWKWKFDEVSLNFRSGALIILWLYLLKWKKLKWEFIDCWSLWNF